MINVYEAELARRHLIEFTKATMPKFQCGWFQEAFYQKLDDFAEGKIKKLMIFVPPQHGKECSHSTPVFTPFGWKKHGDLRPGDEVFNREGKPVKVLRLFPDCRSQYDVTFTDGTTIQCHGKHEWVVFDRRTSKAKQVKIETEQMLLNGLWIGNKGRGGRGRYQVDENKIINLPAITLPMDPYVLGAWLGDGSATANVITHHKDDTQVINKIIGAGYALKKQSAHKTTGVIVSRFDKLYKDIKDYGLFANKHIPEVYFTGSVQQRLELLAGLIDTDGYVYHKNGRITFSNINKRLIDDVKKLAVSLGLRVTVCKFDPVLSTSGIGGKNVVYQLCFNPNSDIPTVIPRKKLINFKPKIRRRSIVSIEKAVKPEMGRCIQVEGGIYLVGETLIPTHNSEGSTRRLPAYIVGKAPNKKQAIVSYNATKARKFNREIQRIIAEPDYQAIFPHIKLSNGADGYSKTFDEFEIPGFEGGVKTVGVDGSLTGDPVDILIMDDLYKNWMEAQSDKTRATVQDWYDSVADTRLHNDSQQLIVFTRWHEYDLAGYLLDKEPGQWEVFLYQALKVGPPTEADPREHGEALYPEKHSREKLEIARARNEHNFESLYQQDPKPIAGLLFPKPHLHFYDPDDKKLISQLADPDFCFVPCDPAGEGGDDFAAGPMKLIDDRIYVTEVLYNTDGTDHNEPALTKLIIRNKASSVAVESVFGWVETAKRVREELENKNFEGEFRLTRPRNNKHSRILNRSSFIRLHFYFRSDYENYPQYAKFIRNLTSYLKIQEAGKGNKHDDAPDLCEMGAAYFERNFAHLFGTGKNEN